MSTQATTTEPPTAPGRAGHTGGVRRTRRVLRWTPAGMAAVVAVDALLGERAEYFDAASLLRAWTDVLAGDGPGHHVFLMGQERLGDVPSLLLGSGLLVVESALLVAAATTARSVAARTRARRRRGHGAPEPSLHTTTTGENR